MWGLEKPSSWKSLNNPFSEDQPRVIPGRVSCRSTEILDIITSEQNALILAGRPKIGKSTLIRYLQLPPSGWSWRNELEADLGTSDSFQNIHFAQIDLKPVLVDYRESPEKLLIAFVRECTRALYQAYKPEGSYADLSLKGLYKLLDMIAAEATNNTRYFLMLDNIELLGSLYIKLYNIKNEAKKPQEFGITLLDRCRAIRTIVDLVDEYKFFSFILAIESLPKAQVVDQFTNISADLARFTTKTLQIFTMDDTKRFLAQTVNDFRITSDSGQDNDTRVDDRPLFSPQEQSWLIELCGTHPYLLRLCCYYLFQFKAYLDGAERLHDKDKEQFLSLIDEQVSTFLSQTWKCLQEAIQSSYDNRQVNEQFQEFISWCASKLPEDAIEDSFWDSLHPDLRYILYSEGIVRSNLFRPVHYPGTILSVYLVKQSGNKPKVVDVQPASSDLEFGHSLRILPPGKEALQIPLSKLEYRLLKTLLANPDYSTEQDLIQSAWEKGTERANFSQRLFKLRKKIEEQLDGINMIDNRYGGIYFLTHPEWLELD